MAEFKAAEAAAEAWDEEESVTLKLVGAYLDGVADTLAGLEKPGPASVHLSTIGTPWSPPRATIRLGELAFPATAVVWPQAGGNGLAAPMPAERRETSHVSLRPVRE